MKNSKKFQFGEFRKMSYLENSKKFQFRTFKKFPKFYNFENHQISIIDKIIEYSNFCDCLISKISNLVNSKNFPNFIISKIIEFLIWKIRKISQILQFWKLKKNPKCYNFKNHQMSNLGNFQSIQNFTISKIIKFLLLTNS